MTLGLAFAGGVRDQSFVGVVLSCSERGTASGDLHRRSARQGRARHGAEQDRCGDADGLAHLAEVGFYRRGPCERL